MNMISFITEEVRRMRPGYDLRFARELMIGNAPPPWTLPDWVLEGIIGSCYEYSWWRDEEGSVVFRRREKPFTMESGLLSYVPPDQMQYFTKRHNGFYIRKYDAAKPDGKSIEEEKS